MCNTDAKIEAYNYIQQLQSTLVQTGLIRDRRLTEMLNTNHESPYFPIVRDSFNRHNETFGRLSAQVDAAQYIYDLLSR